MAYKHGMRNTGTWKCWSSMRDRCFCKTHPFFDHYGGRGIKICERWSAFENFLADMGTRPDGMTLDRIDNNGNYEPSNCRWTSMKEQNRNRRRAKYYEAFGLT